jgi:hypothetical protein
VGFLPALKLTTIIVEFSAAIDVFRDPLQPSRLEHTLICRKIFNVAARLMADIGNLEKFIRTDQEGIEGIAAHLAARRHDLLSKTINLLAAEHMRQKLIACRMLEMLNERGIIVDLAVRDNGNQGFLALSEVYITPRDVPCGDDILDLQLGSLAIGLSDRFQKLFPIA